jgi:hypothetical protein
MSKRTIYNFLQSTSMRALENKAYNHFTSKKEKPERNLCFLRRLKIMKNEECKNILVFLENDIVDFGEEDFANSFVEGRSGKEAADDVRGYGSCRIGFQAEGHRSGSNAC